MKESDKFYFDLLKEEVFDTFSKKQKVFSNIREWKGDEITLFQEDLSVKVGTSISEKWFYTYFKNEPCKLPRIDMLNLLSEYAGYQNWSSFKGKHQKKINSKFNPKKLFYALLGLVLVALIIGFSWKSENEFNFCFVDQLTDEAILQIPLSIKVLNEKESPVVFKTDSVGCFNYKTTEDFIRFVIQSPYHKTDTITRYIDTHTNESVKVARDDYALMLRYYTSGNVKDWQVHKWRLENLILDEAVIYQIHNESIGIEVFTKEDFIRILTVPTSDLKRVKILEKRMKNGKIESLKFMLL